MTATVYSFPGLEELPHINCYREELYRKSSSSSISKKPCENVKVKESKDTYRNCRLSNFPISGDMGPLNLWLGRLLHHQKLQSVNLSGSITFIILHIHIAKHNSKAYVEKLQLHI